MKEGWEEKKLKEIAKYRRGSFPQPYGNKDWYDGEDSMPFIQVAELQEDSFNLVPVTKRRISKIAQPLSVFVPAGTVLVSLQGSIGKVAITDYDSYVDRTIAIFQDYKIKIDKTFFAYQLKIRFEIERLKARGTTIKTITKEEFANFIINCPPLSEQQSIVDYLDSAFAKIDTMKANAEKALNEAKALFQASLKEMLEPKEGWEKKTLKDNCKVINGRAYSKDEMLKHGKYRLLRVGNFFTNDNWYYSDLELEEDKYCDNGDLLYAWSASFGPRIWDGEKVIYHYHIWKMVCSAEIDKYFMCYWLDSDELKKQTMTNLHGATMAHITKGIIEAVNVSFPSLSEQQSIVATLDSLKSKVDRLQENYDKISQECDALKQAILRQVFE